MSSLRCLFSSSRALHSVFMQPMPGTTIKNSTRVPVYLLSPRLFGTTSPQLYIRSRPKPPAAGGGGKKDTKISRLPSDNAIPYRWIRIAGCEEHGIPPENPESNSDLSGPQRTADVLRNLNRQKYSLVMVALPQRNRSKAGEEEEEDDRGGEETLETLAEREKQNIPVCRIIDKYAYAKALDEKEKAARKKQLKLKEMELNWAIAPNDLLHRLAQLKAFLNNGKRVEIMLAKKKRGRAASQEEGQALLKALRDTAEEAGAKEVKSDGRFPGVVKLIFENKEAN